MVLTRLQYGTFDNGHSVTTTCLFPIGWRGERARNRTVNLVIKSHLLCQLSYAPTLCTVPNSAANRLHRITSSRYQGKK